MMTSFHMPPLDKLDIAMLAIAFVGAIWIHALRRQNENLRKESSRRRNAACSVHCLVAVVERDSDTGLLVASVPGVPGAHTQGSDFAQIEQQLGEVMDEIHENGGTAQPASQIVGFIFIQSRAGRTQL